MSEEIELDLIETDDVGFVHLVRPIVGGVIRLVAPSEVYVIKVDSWFGDKWLGFSYKALGQLSVHHRRTLRVPPFVPARIASQRHYRRGAGERYELDSTSPPLHVEQTSEENARRRMSTTCPDAAVFWWSGGSRQNRRGSLMTYLPTPEGHTGWYAEFRHETEWRPAKTLETTAQELAAYAG